VTIPRARRPSTAKRDAQVFRRWNRGDEPKSIMAELHLTKDQYYDGLARHQSFLYAEIRKKPNAKKRGSK
jgi:hypothetical protein